MGEQCSRSQQALTDDLPGIAQKVFKNREKSVGAKGFGPETLMLPKNPLCKVQQPPQ